jgi:hypothetical protein
MFGNVSSNEPYHDVKTRVHNQSIGCRVEWETPLKKDSKAKSYALNGGRR